jgi:hypothetical protein
MLDREYQLSWQLAYYLRAQYPTVMFRHDMAGLKLSKAQAGKNKVIQNGKGWPDLFLAEPRGPYHGFFLELKIEGTCIFKTDGKTPLNDHIADQMDVIRRLVLKGYHASFGIGFDDCKFKIDNYLTGKR